VDIKEIDPQEMELVIKGIDLLEVDIREIDPQEMELDIKEIDLLEADIKEIDLPEVDIREIGPQEKEMDIKETDLPELATREIDLPEKVDITIVRILITRMDRTALMDRIVPRVDIKETELAGQIAQLVNTDREMVSTVIITTAAQDMKAKVKDLQVQAKDAQVLITMGEAKEVKDPTIIQVKVDQVSMVVADITTAQQVRVDRIMIGLAVLTRIRTIIMTLEKELAAPVTIPVQRNLMRL
jgi:hypothetical protein